MSNLNSLQFVAAVWKRFRDADAAGASAASAFSMLLALVPLTTVIMSVLGSSRLFGGLSESLQGFIYQQLVPSAAGNVEVYLDEFVAKAEGLTLLGSLLLLLTSLNLLYTIERYLNRIFGNQKRHSLGMRLIVYWAMLTLMPLLFGVSITLTSVAIAHAKLWIGGDGIGWFLGRIMPMVLVSVAFSVLFVSLPNRAIRFTSAIIGGAVAALLFELAKSLFALWAGRAVGYQAIYGAMAILPLFLVWMWVCWLVTFVGACVAVTWEER